MSRKAAPRHPTDNAKTRQRSTEDHAPPPRNISNEERFQLIQVRAYGLWEQAGMPDGDAARERFWRQAEDDLIAFLAMRG